MHTPITSFLYTDDPIATPQAGQDILDLYPNAKTERIIRQPSDYGVKKIGHNGPFQPHHRAAQRNILERLAHSANGQLADELDARS